MRIKSITAVIQPHAALTADILSIEITVTEACLKHTRTIHITQDDLVSHYDLLFDCLKKELWSGLQTQAQLLSPPPALEPDPQTLYQQLLMAVARKFPGESRHQTALRYIHEAEAACTCATPAQEPAPLSPPSALSQPPDDNVIRNQG